MLRHSLPLFALLSCVSLIPANSADGKQPAPTSGSVLRTESIEMTGTLFVNRRGEYFIAADGKYYALDFGGRMLADAQFAGSAKGKYTRLLAVIRVPADAQQYGTFNDWGMWTGNAWAGFKDLPAGRWVYSEPYWFIWEAEENVQSPLAQQDFTKLIGERVSVSGNIKDFKDKMARPHETIEVHRLQAQRDLVKRVARVELKGKLDSRRVPLNGIEIPLRGDERALPFYTEWFVTVDGVEYLLDLQGAVEFEQTARQLNGKQVLLKGILTQEPFLPYVRPACLQDNYPPLLRVIRVESLQPAPVEEIKVELQGRLKVWELGKALPIRIVEVEVDAQCYRLVFADGLNRALANNLDGRYVRVVGVLTSNTIRVASVLPI